ncbi:MAG TPA: hypothetical protein VFG83_16870 [Kofleriaceae bacterium]|nr:hypothetical protein [Kofleriaceae bacterium]
MSVSFGATRDVLEYLGFVDAADGDDFAWVSSVISSEDRIKKIAANPPFEIRPFQRTRNGRIRNMAIDIEDAEGAFYDVGLPAPLDQYVNADGNPEGWGIFRIGGNAVFAGHTDKTGTIDHIETAKELGPFPQDLHSLLTFGVTADQPGQSLQVTQLVVLEGTVTDIIARLLASTDGNGVNHATYDVLPWGAAIPWELLGDDFLDSLKSLEQSDESGAITVVVDKPMKLEDVILPELMLRYAWLIFRVGHLVATSPPTPSVTGARFSLDETNKARALGEEHSPTLPRISSGDIFNVVKVEYNRRFWTDEYLDSLEIRNGPSIQEYGDQGTLSIRARNSYDGTTHSAESVVALATSLAARMIPVFGRPLRIMTRPISHQQFGISPGDIVSISDDLARNPQSGARGMIQEPATVLHVSHQYPGRGRGAYGEVTVIFTEEGARLFPMAPSARILAYDEVTKTVTLDVDGYSRGLDPADVTYFETNDKVRIFELGNAAGGGDADMLDSVDIANNKVVLASGFVFDAAKTYVLVFDDYSQIQGTQGEVAYQCNSGTGLVAGSQDANVYGDEDFVKFGASNGEEPSDLVPEAMAGDGRPLSTALVGELSRSVNQMIQWNTQPSIPILSNWTTPIAHPYVVGEWVLEACFPVWVGAGLSFPTRRKISVAPWFSRNLGSGTVEVRISISHLPPAADDDLPSDPRSTVIFSTDSTTPVAPEPQPLELVAEPGGHAFVTVHARVVDDALASVLFRGLAEFTVGAPFLKEPSYPANAAEFAAAMQVPLGPSHYWHFEQTSGDCPDLAGDAPLSPDNSPTQGIEATDLKSKVVRFDDGSTGRMVAADSTKVQVGDESLCVIWIGRLNAAPTVNRGLFGKRTATAGWYVRMAASGIADWNVESAAGDDSVNSPNFEAMVGDPIIMMFRHDRALGICQASIWHDGEVVDGAPASPLVATDLTNNSVFTVGNFLFGASAADVAAVAVFQGAAAEGMSSASLANLAESIGL